MATTYKETKEAFYSNGTGSSLHVINAVSAAGAAGYLLQIALLPLLPKNAAIDFIFEILPLLLATTVLSSYPFALLSIILGLALVLLWVIKPPSENAGPISPPQGDEELKKIVKSDSALTLYRSQMMVITCLSILAVDFPVFPRSFGKTEVWGSGLMDMGVGSFVYSLGFVSSKSLSASSPTKGPLYKRLFSVVKKSAPVLALGLVRVAMVKGVDYHEHVTEYGVHWNFFFTLGLLPTLGVLISPLGQLLSFPLLGFLVTAAHQLVLLLTPLQSFILSTDHKNTRRNFFEANKEGFSSLLGYLSIYLFAVGLGSTYASTSFTARSAPVVKSAILHWSLLIASLALIAPSSLTSYFTFSSPAVATGAVDGGISRRLANTPYVFWVCAFNASSLALYRGAWLLSSSRYSTVTTDGFVPPLLEAINKNSLTNFLAANLLTGLTNLSIDTLSVTDTTAVGVLILYAGVWSALACALKGRRSL